MAKLAKAFTSKTLTKLSLFVGSLEKVTSTGLVALARLNPSLVAQLESYALEYSLHHFADSQAQSICDAVGLAANAKTVSLELGSAQATPLSGKGVVDCLASFTSCPALTDLYFHVEGQVDWAAGTQGAGNVVSSMNKLQRFGVKFAGTGFSDQAAHDFFAGLSSSSSITALDVDVSNNPVGDGSFITIVSAAASIGTLVNLGTTFDSGLTSNITLTPDCTIKAAATVTQSAIKSWNISADQGPHVDAAVAMANGLACVSPLATIGANGIKIASVAQTFDPHASTCLTTYTATVGAMSKNELSIVKHCDCPQTGCTGNTVVGTAKCPNV